MAVMTGIAFTFGMFIGLLVHLPAATLPAVGLAEGASSHMRAKRSLEEIKALQIPNSELKGISYGSSQESVGDGFGNKSHIAYISLPHAEQTVPREHVQSSEVEPSGLKNNVLDKPRDSIEVSDLPTRAAQDSRTVNEDKAIEVSIRVGKLSKSANVKSSRVNDENVLASGGTAPVSDIIDGITWTQSIHAVCPAGFTQSDSDSWASKLASSKFVKLEEGCGRMQNRMLTFADASKACARYRMNTDQIQGEIYSYYLGKLLNITNLPPTKLELVRPTDELWRQVHLNIARSQWVVDKVVVLTKWIDDLGPAYIPPEFRDSNIQLKPDSSSLSGKTGTELCELVQWSDLVVFDYLTANLDRVVNNMFNKQWNSQMMESPTHNLEKSKDGRLVFLDNESGLFHGYRLLDKYSPFHEELLGSLCVFRKNLVDTVKRLVKEDSIEKELFNIFAESEPLHKHIPKIPQKYLRILKQRLRDVVAHIDKCERTYLR